MKKTALSVGGVVLLLLSIGLLPVFGLPYQPLRTIRYDYPYTPPDETPTATAGTETPTATAGTETPTATAGTETPTPTTMTPTPATMTPTPGTQTDTSYLPLLWKNTDGE